MNDAEAKKDSLQIKFIHDKSATDSFVYILPGIPIPLKRHQHGNGNTWDSQKKNKLMTGITIRSQQDSRPMYQGPLHLDIRFYFPIPLRGERSKTTWEQKLHEIKPDISNCIKYVEDVCSKLLYHDDCQIASVYSEKRYDKEPRTEFYILELK